MKPKIAIIGANEAINILICKAKEKGYETHVFAWECGDPGEKSADHFYPISVADKEKILKICRSLNVEGVASVTSDFAVNTVNFVARNLGLVCNSEVTDMVARDKYLMRCAFRDNGLYTPWFFKATSQTDLSFMARHSYPVIVKPTDRWSSKGVTCVRTFKELQDAVNYAITESMSDEAIIEDFMEGPEYSAECICQNGECHILTITEKATTGFPHYVETGHKQPATLPVDMEKYIYQVVKKAVHALDIKNSAAHAEFRIIDGKEVGIIEIGARMGGDYIGTDLVPLSTGYDYVGMVIDVSCGNPLNFTRSKHYSKSEVKFLLTEEDYEQYLHYMETGNKHIERALIFDSDFSKQILNSADRHGYYIVCER